MISLLVLVILLAIGVPSFRSLATQDRITRQTNEMLVGLQLARSEAIRQRATVSFCSSANGTSCDTQAPYWTSGWVVLRGGQPIRVGEAPHTGLTVSVNPSATSTVLFNATGAASPSVNFQISSGSAAPRCIRVLVSGFVASEKLPCPTS
jgi:type IV fimbrial biogenesis protein FimT